MIIVTFTEKEFEIGQKTMDLYRSMDINAYVVPHDVTYLFISATEEGELTVTLYSGEQGAEEIGVITGIPSVNDCWMYAKAVVGALDLPEENIDADIWECTITEGKYGADVDGNGYLIREKGGQVIPMYKGYRVDVLHNGDWMEGNYADAGKLEFGSESEEPFSLEEGSRVRMYV